MTPTPSTTGDEMSNTEKLTTEELEEMFGPNLPLAAWSLIATEAGHGLTLPEVRSRLREIAAAWNTRKRKKLSKRALYRTALLHAIDERESLADAYGGKGETADRARWFAAEYRRLLREDYGEALEVVAGGKAVPLMKIMTGTNKETDQ